MAVLEDGSALSNLSQLAPVAAGLTQMSAHPKVSQLCHKHSSFLGCVTRQKKVFLQGLPWGGVTAMTTNRVPSGPDGFQEKFLPEIMPGSGHQGRTCQKLLGAEPFISTGLQLFLSICITMNPSPVTRKEKIFMVSPSHHGLSHGPRTGLARTIPLLQPLPCQLPHIPSSSRGRMHFPGQVERGIIICLGIFPIFLRKQFPPSASLTELGKCLSDPSTVFSSP